MDRSVLWWLALGLMTVVLVVGGVVYWRVRRSVVLMRQRNVLLEGAVGNIIQGLNMFDQSGGLVLSNQRYSEMYRLPPGAVKPGVTMRELIDLRIAAGTFFKTDPDRYREMLDSAITGRTATQG